ncbi:hypothetical protein AB0D38_47745, partial [Streptomyces sp. NPDC048279]
EARAGSFGCAGGKGEPSASPAGALREAAVRAVRWSGQSVAFPGLAERDAPLGRAGASASASPSASSTP